MRSPPLRPADFDEEQYEHAVAVTVRVMDNLIDDETPRMIADVDDDGIHVFITNREHLFGLRVFDDVRIEIEDDDGSTVLRQRFELNDPHMLTSSELDDVRDWVGTMSRPALLEPSF